MVPDVNAMVLGKDLELLNVNIERFEINQLLFAVDTADSEEKWCRLLSEFGTIQTKDAS